MTAADELAHVGDERRVTIDGPQPAFDAYIFGTQSRQADVFLFYDTELKRLGWLSDRHATFRASDEIQGWGWCKGRANFRLAIKNQGTAFRSEFYRGRAYGVVFDASISSRDSSVACPLR